MTRISAISSPTKKMLERSKSRRTLLPAMVRIFMASSPWRWPATDRWLRGRSREQRRHQRGQHGGNAAPGRQILEAMVASQKWGVNRLTTERSPDARLIRKDPAHDAEQHHDECRDCPRPALSMADVTRPVSPMAAATPAMISRSTPNEFQLAHQHHGRQPQDGSSRRNRSRRRRATCGRESTPARSVARRRFIVPVSRSSMRLRMPNCMKKRKNTAIPMAKNVATSKPGSRPRFPAEPPGWPGPAPPMATSMSVGSAPTSSRRWRPTTELR